MLNSSQNTRVLLPIAAATTAVAVVSLLWLAGHSTIVAIYSILTPDNTGLGWLQLALLIAIAAGFSISGFKYPLKRALLSAFGFFLVWVVLSLAVANLIQLDLIALPVFATATLVLIISHLSKLWSLDTLLTKKLLSLFSTGNLVTGVSPELRVETGLRLLETILPKSEIIVFQLKEKGSLVALGRAKGDLSSSSSKERNTVWQKTVEQCEEALESKETILVSNDLGGDSAKIAIPLLCDESVIGVLFVKVNADFQKDDIALLEAFADQFARNFERNELKSKSLPHDSWWSSFSTQSAQNRLFVTGLLDGIVKEKSFGSLATSHMTPPHAVAYLDGTIAHLNRTICEMGGITGDQINELDLFSLLDRFRTPVFNDPSLAIRRVLQTGSTFTAELSFPEQSRVLQLEIIPVKLPVEGGSDQHEQSEKPACLLITLQNISEKKENLKLRSDMASLMSHELRTPITSIHGFAEMLLSDDTISEETREYLQIISNESQRASSLLSNFLSVSNLEQSDKMELEKVPVKINYLVHEVVKEFRSAAKIKRIRVVEKHDPDIVPVSADPGLITVAVSHLLDNAIKYSAPRTAVIISSNLEPDHVRIDVEDRGFGIPSGEQQKIWEKFYRVTHTGQSKQDESTGLGLSLVKEIVENHHGKVSVASATGKGSRFSIWLPRL